jgi:DNA-binding winged helix-turn-helix (wHTH) protein
MACYRFEDCALDTSRRELIRAGKVMKLSPRAFEALETLLKSYPSAVSKQHLYAALWPNTFVNLTTLNNVIAEIRSAIGDRSKRLVVTKHRFGYVIGVPVIEQMTTRPIRSRFTLAIGGETIVLREGENLVGRTSDAVVLLDLPPISRHHALIRVSGDRVAVEDMQSKNGTFVDGERVRESRELHDRATICFGSICGVFRAIEAGGTTATDPAIKPEA